MRRFAFIITIFGIFALLLLLNSKPIEITSQEQLQFQEINQKVFLTGKIVQEKTIYQNKKLLTLDNDIELICECPLTLKDARISVLGIVSGYNNKKQIAVLRVKQTA